MRKSVMEPVSMIGLLLNKRLAPVPWALNANVCPRGTKENHPSGAPPAA